MDSQNIYVGDGGIERLAEILRVEAPESVFVFTGKGSFDSSSFKEKFLAVLSGYKSVFYSDFNPNPTSVDVRQAEKVFNQQKVGLVIAIGGGSVLDMAKLALFFATTKLDVEKFLVSGESLPSQKMAAMVAIPTTAGTGSESTQFATIYIDKKKYSLDREDCLAKYAIVDPTFTCDMPEVVAANTAADAFCQAVESFWSKRGTSESRKFALSAIKLLLENTAEAIAGNCERAKLQVCIGSNLAGQAINISRTT
ncbi:MAG: iron-containing alcohol dehydrogenase, partial [Thiotrichaceae bacterium]|nr:iron-containing alcohol dehydrogenase [Thiotrichaceae bacterium]